MTPRRRAASPPRSSRLAFLRPLSLLVHRWVGLFLAVFLIVAGTTGSMMAFYPQLDALLNPELFVVEPPTPDAKLLDPFELHARIAAQFPKENIGGVLLQIHPRESVNYWIDDRETFVDPYTGRVLGSREFGSLREGKKSVLTFLYELHFTLGLGDVGRWLFGAVAALWTFDCFVGAYLTFPLPLTNPGARTKPWLARWLPAWGLKTGKLFSLVFSWHRASGLWIWGILLVFAWSAVALNWSEQLYEPVMDAALPRPPRAEQPHLATPRLEPRLKFEEAHRHGLSLLALEASRHDFEIFAERWLDYDPEHGTYALTVESSLDVDERLADTTVVFDGNDGHLVEFHAPTGENARDTFDSWIIALHFGAWREGGLAYRSFVCLCGVLVTLLSVTGIWIWWRKRSKRPASAAKAR